MIISQTPFRIPLGGGGCDIPAYYEKNGASLVATSVDKYVYVILKKRFSSDIRVSYSQTEIVNSANEIRHPVVREALRYLGINGGLEIVSIADVPANTGLGTSSSFTVGLLHALHVYLGESPSADSLAKQAVEIERSILREPGGLQDQYVAAYGGLINIEIEKTGEVKVNSLALDKSLIAELESRLLFFYTGIHRRAPDIQAPVEKAIKKGEESVLDSLHNIKLIGEQIKEALLKSDLDLFGKLLHEHWNHKRKVSNNISSTAIDRWYNLAINAGALGGKLIGAGGGGFLMFYSPENSRDNIRTVLMRENLKEVQLRFEKSGSKIMINI